MYLRRFGSGWHKLVAAMVPPFESEAVTLEVEVLPAHSMNPDPGDMVFDAGIVQDCKPVLGCNRSTVVPVGAALAARA